MNRKNAVLILFVYVCGLFLSGCWDRVEIENRRFAVAIAVDAAEDKDEGVRYTVALALPVLTKDKDNGGGADIRKASGATVAEALARLDTETDKRVYLGQMKTLVLGEQLTEDAALFSDTITALDHLTELDRQMLVVAAEGKAADILEARAPEETLPGLYIAELYKNKNKQHGETFKLQFGKLNTTLSASGRTALPLIRSAEEKLSLSGARIVRDAHTVGTLDGSETRGLLWCRSDGCIGAVVTDTSAEAPASMTVKRHKVRLMFGETAASGGSGERLRCEVYVSVTGESDNDTPYAKLIAEEITRTAAKLQIDPHTDAYGWLDTLRKQQYGLYKKYAADWERAFVEMEIVPRVTVRLRDTAR